MRHRHLDVPSSTPVVERGLAALDDILDRGDLTDWLPLLDEVRRDPWGVVADRVLHLVEHHPMYGTSNLWRSWIAERRHARPAPHAGQALRELRVSQGLTQQQVAVRLDMTQPEVSKLERRADIRLSTLRAYVGALGGVLALSARIGDRELPIEPER